MKLKLILIGLTIQLILSESGEYILAAEDVCVDATSFVADNNFTAPFDGVISGIKLVHTSGGVTCNHEARRSTNWGCANGQTLFSVQMIRIDDNLPGFTYYPTAGTRNITNLDAQPNCDKCKVGFYNLDSGFTLDDDQLILIDTNNTYQVATNDQFSLQEFEGCCDSQTDRNRGTSCADVYFLYDSINTSTPTSSPSTEPTMNPTSDPTLDPTLDPTIDPTVDPTSDPTTEPTLDPTIDPTADPTVQVCSEEDIGTFSWDELTEDASNAPRFNVTQFDVNEEDLSLNIEVELEYLGKVTADYQSEANYGVTYVLDFESYNAHKDAIYEPGSCQNRDGASFNDSSLKFEDYWTYSDQPLWGNVGTNEFLAYPPPGDDWTVSMKDSDKCGTIVYQGHFTWNELTSCESFGGDSYITTIDDTENNEIRLEGVFYINVVSPFAASSDLGYYRVYQLLSQPFVISVSKTVYVLGSTGINVLTMSVIAVYKEDNSNTFKLMILTEAQNYLELTRTSSGVYLFEPSGSGNNLIETGEFIAPSSAEEGCLNNKQFLCSQIWEIRAENVNCNGNEKGIDFSGDYTLQFMPKCRNESIIGADLSAYCQEWLGNHSDIADGVDLETSLSWKDEVCDPQLFTVQFQASMNFYVDGYDNPAPSDQLYQVGEDTIYIEIDTSFPSDTYNVFDTELVNVWICTFPPNEGPSIPIEAGLAEGGCFSDNRDGGNATSDNPYFYHIYSVDGPIEEEGFNLIGHPDDSLESKDELQFSFVVPDKIARDTLYIHAQIEVELSDQSEPLRPRRRRLLTTASGSGSIANQMDHFLGNIGINRNKNNYKPNRNGDYNPNPNPNRYPPQQIPFQSPATGTTATGTSSSWLIVIGSILGLLLFGNILFFCYVNCLNKQQRARVSFDHRRRSGYESVNKHIDSEDCIDSEAQLIVDSEHEKDDE